LQHHPRADRVGLAHQIAGIAEREGDDPWPKLAALASTKLHRQPNDVNIGERDELVDRLAAESVGEFALAERADKEAR
jgi:hypothetical protein